MKKKAIEKIAYITIPEAGKEKDAKYVGITALQEINHEPHIFLEVYRNEMHSFQVPLVRYVATAKDWGVYFPETGVWTRQKITTHDWHEGMCWNDKGECGRTYGERRTFNQLYSLEDLVRIKEFFNEVKIWNDTDWWEYFERHETNIKIAAEHRKYQLRRERLEERCANTPALQENQILEWADGNIFGKKHFIYYKKKGRRATICCSKCGGIKEGTWKHGESFESWFETHIEEPRDKHMGKCPLCGILAMYKPQGKAGSRYSVQAHTFTADKYKDNGVVIRYIKLEKSWVLEEFIGAAGVEDTEEPESVPKDPESVQKEPESVSKEEIPASTTEQCAEIAHGIVEEVDKIWDRLELNVSILNIYIRNNKGSLEYIEEDSLQTVYKKAIDIAADMERLINVKKYHTDQRGQGLLSL